MACRGRRRAQAPPRRAQGRRAESTPRAPPPRGRDPRGMVRVDHRADPALPGGTVGGRTTRKIETLGLSSAAAARARPDRRSEGRESGCPGPRPRSQLREDPTKTRRILAKRLAPGVVARHELDRLGEPGRHSRRRRRREEERPPEVHDRLDHQLRTCDEGPATPSALPPVTTRARILVSRPSSAARLAPAGPRTPPRAPHRPRPPPELLGERRDRGERRRAPVIEKTVSVTMTRRGASRSAASREASARIVLVGIHHLSRLREADRVDEARVVALVGKDHVARAQERSQQCGVGLAPARHEERRLGAEPPRRPLLGEAMVGIVAAEQPRRPRPRPRLRARRAPWIPPPRRAPPSRAYRW